MPDDIRPGDCVIVTARVKLVVTTDDGKQVVYLDLNDLDRVDADRCMVVGRDA